MARTGFYWDETCFWHTGGNYASVAPVGGLVQPQAAGGIPENPETKRRLKNLIEVTGLIGELDARGAPPASHEELRRVHPETYLSRFKAMSDAGGGELGERTPFGPGGYEIAAQSAGLVRAALASVLSGEHANAYALSRPPGHHCEPDRPMGFCLMANIAIAIEAAIAEGAVGRVAVIDWDVHHGNGTEAVFYERSDVLTVSIHQERNYPWDRGGAEARGAGAGEGFNVNLPLSPGAGHDAYLHAFERVIDPVVRAYRPEAIVVACGYDASDVDPLGRMVAGSATFAGLTERTMALADDLCGGRLTLAHEGGYSEAHVPFCGHAVLEKLSGSAIRAPDPLAPRVSAHQPNARMQAVHRAWIDELAEHFGV